jgi:hypothetical protein
LLAQDKLRQQLAFVAIWYIKKAVVVVGIWYIKRAVVGVVTAKMAQTQQKERDMLTIYAAQAAGGPRAGFEEHHTDI